FGDAGRGGGPETGAAASDNATAGTPAPDAAPQSKQWIDGPDLPIDYYSDLIVLAQLRDMDIAAAGGGTWEVEQEEFTAQCMKGKGFTYYPRQVEASTAGESDVKAGFHGLMVPWLPDDLADVERYGYGHFSPDVLPSQDLTALEPAAPDPNAQYVAALSASAQAAYKAALYGAEHAAYSSEDFLPDTAAPPIGGCMGDAILAHPMPLLEVVDQSPLTAYDDLIEQLGNQAGSPYAAEFLRRAEVDALDTAWRQCFEQDFSLAGPPAGQDTGVLMPDPAEPEPEPSLWNGPSAAWDLALLTDADGNYWDGDVAAAPLAYSSLTGTPREVAIAVADYKCRSQTDYVNRFTDIKRAAQEEFIAAHKAQLDQLAAALEAYVNG
ncbi:MAG: hypothetical protein LBD70_02550, partial [Bifidobacteriaceae bacterium]|nr:hypothetical protein [Bifidobacteriaceae bacterium]